MNTTTVGRQAEAAAADYLSRQGFSLIEHNYRTPVCEIDLIARKQKCVYFIEVKYRASAAQGTGLDYITPKKLQQMQFAAEIWMREHRWSEDCALGAIEVWGSEFQIGEFIDAIF